MTAAEKLAFLKSITTTSDTDATLNAYILIAGQVILNRAYPFANVDPDRIVKETDMVVGAYTVAAQPDVPRNITVTVTAGDTSDTLGTIVVMGTDVSGAVLTETITPIANATVDGASCFKKITSVVGVGWAVDTVEGTNDTIMVGVGDIKAVPSKYEYKQCQIALYLLNKRGADGQTAHNENGVSRSYENGDVPESMLSDVIPQAGVFI
jgi:hypothetical protein